MSASGMMPPTRTPTCSRPGLAQQLQDARHQRHVGAAEEAEAEPVGVLVGDGADDRLGRLPQAGVDDVHAGVAQGPGHDLDAAVVAVEADLGEDDRESARMCSWSTRGIRADLRSRPRRATESTTAPPRRSGRTRPPARS